MKVLVLNKNNIVDGTNNSKFRFKFSKTVSLKKGTKLAISKINMYYSWENITSSLNNQSFSYTWWNNSGVQNKTYTLTIPQGYYTYGDINDWLYNELCTRGHYLTFASESNTVGNSNGQAWSSSTKYVFLELMENATYYACQFRLYALPAYVLTNPPYTKPANVTGYEWRVPSLIIDGLDTFYPTPSIIVSSSNKFSDIIGFDSGTYGTGRTASSGGVQDYISTKVPTLDPVGSVLVLCTLANNSYSSPNNLIDTFTYSVDYGAMIAIENNNLNWIDVMEGTYSEFFIEFKNQDFGNMVIKDDKVVITMILDEPNE